MLQLEHLSVGYDTRTLLADVSLTLPAGRLVALLGRNGTGKSTLLRSLVGLEPRLGGEVRFDGKALSSLSVAERSRLVSLVTTERVRVPNLRVRELVAMGRAPYTNWTGRLTADDEARVTRALELTGMAAYVDKMMDCMSDGECQRVMIARALAQDTPVILLDEPTSFLDLPNRYDLCQLLKKLVREAGKLVLFSTHELDIALSMCDIVMLIDNPGLYCLPTPEMVASGHIERLFRTSSVGFDISEWTEGNYAVRIRPDASSSRDV